ncbi:hypothetical protein HPB50_020434 [Hyalomma asiaticum]|uniref:Uncharacterized protein n=1 Tax=Hyalomma asiaticum TaxID=266040 RepID=A0ACB7RY90_HYAAI|nr:hypothetical protein HPB50_020434 [Hyalomma asiaticum]
MFFLISLLALAVTNDAMAAGKSEAALLEENGWKDLPLKGNPLFQKLAAKAATSFKDHIDFYQVMVDVISVHKKASGECTSMFTVKGSKAENAVLDWVHCNDFMAPRRRRYPVN